jgi:hypothetical protein
VELVHDPRRGHGLAAMGPGQVQRSPSASQGRGGHGQGCRASSCNARGRRAQQAGGASRPRQFLAPTLGLEPQAHQPALYIHLWLDHIKALPKRSASSSERLLTKEAQGLPAAVRGAKRESTPSMLRLTSHANSTTPWAGKRPTPRVSVGS